ncbi:O-antigen ligase family protein [Pantoea agglomerans]|uniref:O-antigen ligase family protein n=1 Tax=Enterobacter agglomerans TaxID=549 RepID=A0ACC5RRI4_ENTAG|nr:O-antigen ligase family protein [Pantoea agglomerans]MBK4727332.1 O-antigen ligase family protein [Pantoea agglomerans]
MNQLLCNDLERRYVNNIFLFLYSLLLYLPATAIMPATTYYFISLCVFIYRVFFGGFNREFYFIAIFLLVSLFISLLAMIFANTNFNYYNNFIPLQVSILCSLIISTSITKKIAYYIICFILIECISGCIQFLLGVKTFFPFVSVAIPEMGDAQGLLYYMRVYGFSENSSGFSGNVIIMITFFSLFFIDQARKIKILVFSFAFIALIVCFSRSGLVAYLLLFLVVFAKDFRVNHLKVLVPAFIVCIIASYYLVDWSSVFTQLTRGRETVELSGRDLIWSYYFQQISDHPIFGNFSLRSFLFIPPYGLMHAHNSYIMLLYVMGVLPLFFMIIPIFYLALRKISVFIFLIALLAYSLAQYFLFWGASLADVTFFAALVSYCSNNRVSPSSIST